MSGHIVPDALAAMTSKREVIDGIINELHGWQYLGDLLTRWRDDHGFKDKQASLLELAEQLARERGLIK